MKKKGKSEEPKEDYQEMYKEYRRLYDEEQGKLKTEIDALQVKLTAVRDKIALATQSGPGNDKESALRAELDGIKTHQSSSKTSRSQTIERIKALQENIQKKVKDLQSARSKTSFKTAEEVDARIKELEKQVESGQMKLVDEKRALAEISNSRRIRRVVDGFQEDQKKIEEDRHTVEELKKQLDDPELKAMSDRFEAITAELATLKAERDEAHASKSKLFEERDGIQTQIKALLDEKRGSAQRFRDANDRYWTKVNEDRVRRDERRRAQKAAEDQQRKKDIAEHLLEEAKTPAYQTQIEDCQTLIDHFSGKPSNLDTSKSIASPKTQLVGVRELELRKVEGAPEGVVVRKKGEEEESYFVGGKGRGRGKKNAQKTSSEGNGAATLHMSLPILSALGTLSIPPPTSPADVPRIIEDLKTKKMWFEANQARTTAESIAKAEAEVKLLTKETPAEPVPTPQTDLWVETPQTNLWVETPQTNLWVDNTSTNEMVDKLDTVLEHEAALEESS
ncbi:hypothetical protein F5887DRAFT_1058314 [Amanita rubescens]|nr:hypothetical protein F5887DRAFT_1058314 [Amanita rubescens]